jgi:hypothetical protein
MLTNPDRTMNTRPAITRHPRIAGGSLSAVALFVLAGCTDSSASLVRGQVTFDGQPIEKGTISFYPVDGKTTTAGGEIKAGAYSVQVPVGLMEVRISMPKVVGQKQLYNKKDSPSYPVHAEALPDKYNKASDLKLDVTAGGVAKDWALTSK